MKNIFHILITALVLTLSTTAGAEILKGKLQMGDKEVAAEFVKLTDHTVAVGNGHNACTSHYTASGMLTIPGTVEIAGTTYEVVEVSALAFRLCDGITGVNIQENVRRIGDYAFIGCPEISNIILPSTLESLGAGVFSSCYANLMSVTCLGTTPPRWEYNDVFRAHPDGIGDNKAAVIAASKVLYVPDEAVYKEASYSNPAIGWTTPDGWSSFSYLSVGQPVYYIYTPADLDIFREIVNAGSTYAGIQRAELQNDIDMTGHVWDSGIGLSDIEPFLGNFYGNGHTISNLTIEGDEYAGFFNFFSGYAMENVTFRNCTVSASDTGYAGVATAWANRVQMTGVSVENCTVANGKYRAALIGFGQREAIRMTECLVKDTRLDGFPSNRYVCGELVGYCRGGLALDCAVIDCDNPSVPPFWTRLRPFVAECADGETFMVHNCYNTASGYEGYEPPKNVEYKNTVLCGNTTLDITDASGQPQKVKLDGNRMKSLFMAPELGANWVYREGEYPLPSAFVRYDKQPEVNKVAYVGDYSDIGINRLWYGGKFSKFLDLSEDGYRSERYETTQVWIDDDFTSGPQSSDEHSAYLPIGTATIECHDGVIYDRTLSAPICGTTVEKVKCVDADKDGEIALTRHGDLVWIDDEVVVSEDKAYEPTAYSVCLPYTIKLNGTTRVFQPASMQQKSNMLAITMTETDKIEAWKPCLVTVEQDSVGLGTTNKVTIMPYIDVDNTISLNDEKFEMKGTVGRIDECTRPIYTLCDDDLWRRETGKVPAFRSYIVDTNDRTDLVFTTGMGYRGDLVNDTLTLKKGLPVTDPDLHWWPITSTRDNFPGWHEMADKIRHIAVDVTFNNARPNILVGWFAGCVNLSAISGMEYFNTSEVTYMYYLFLDCESVETLDLRYFNTAKVTDTNSMFQNCHSLKKVIVGKDWNMDWVSLSLDMFKNCESIVGQCGVTYNPAFTDKQKANAVDGYLWKDYPYYIAVQTDAKTIQLQGSDTAPDDHNTFDALAVGDVPSWYHLYRGTVNTVTVLPTFSMARPTTCRRWFGSTNLKTIGGLSHLNTSQVTNMSHMFEGCQGTRFNVEDFDTHNVTDMSAMFKDCKQLTTLDVTGFNTSSVANMQEMFARCEQLSAINVTGFKTFNVENMQDMFADCHAVEELDLNNFNIDKLDNTAAMFVRCGSLRTIWCDKSWTDVPHSANMFALCNNLQGAKKYEETDETLDGRMANPETGYFMGTPAISLYDTKDNSATLAEYDGRKVNVTYDRVLRAIPNDDGTFKSKAYTICLPYDLNLTRSMVEDKVGVYTIHSLNDNNELLFSTSAEDGAILQAGHAYVLVVFRDSITLNADRVFLTAQPYVGDDVVRASADASQSEEVVGKWLGLFTDQSNSWAVEHNAYGLSNGVWRRYSNENDYYRAAHPYAFRAFYCSKAPTGINYSMTYTYAAGEGPFMGVKIDEYDDDYNRMGGTGIHDITNGQSSIFDAQSYYDLQGRPLTSPPAKGVYIDSGKKVKK
jgi:surface protein